MANMKINFLPTQALVARGDSAGDRSVSGPREEGKG